MTKYLKDRLTKVLESHESAKTMLAANIMAGQAHQEIQDTPGEFSKEEITNLENLVNKGENANTNSYKGAATTNADCIEDLENSMEDLMDDLLDISVVKKPEVEDEHHHFGESHMGKFLEKLLTESKLFTESDYAGPLDFVPDTRFNTSDVLNALKAKIGEGSEGINVDLDYDAEGSKVYKVSQIDTDKLPKTLEVVNVQLKLGDNGYTVEKTREDFPVKKD